jgi:hypothetical protein
MSTVADLMGLGMPGPLANRIGNTPLTIAGVGTAQVGAAAIQTSATFATTSGGATAFVLPTAASLGREFWVFNSTATTALVFPPTSGTIQGGSANASFSVAQNKTAVFMRMTSTAWAAVLSA